MVIYMHMIHSGCELSQLSFSALRVLSFFWRVISLSYFKEQIEFDLILIC